MSIPSFNVLDRLSAYNADNNPDLSEFYKTWIGVSFFLKTYETSDFVYVHQLRITFVST